MTVTASHRERLEQIRERTRAARQQRAKGREAVDAAREMGDRDAQVIAEGALQAVDIELETAERLEAMLLSQLAGVNGHGLRDGFLDDPGMVGQLEQLAHTSAPIGNLLLGRFMSAETFAATLGRGIRAQGSGGGDVIVPASARQQAPYGIVRALYQPLDLLDLLPTATMTGAAFSYVIEGGPLDEGAAETAEGAIKPEGSVELDEGEVVARTIASWIKARRQVLDDVAGLQTVLEERLMQLVRQRIQTQVLSGDGVDPNLLGVLNRDGIGTVAYSAGTAAADAILRGLTTVRVAGAAPTGVVLNPATYESILTERDEGGGRLDSPGALAGAPLDSLWGINVVQTNAIGPDKAVVADWARAATLFVREGLTTRISDSDQDDFTRNRITILVETRVGLMVSYPQAVCVVELSAATGASAQVKAKPAPTKA